MLSNIKSFWDDRHVFLKTVRIAIIIILILLLLVIFLEQKFFLNYDVISFYVPLAITFGGMVALGQWLNNDLIRTSREYLDAAVNFLEKSYKALSPNEDSSLPQNDRMVWMRSSRLLLTSLKLGEQITDKTHKIIFEESKEYWRGAFHELLFPNGDKNLYPKDYYADDVKHYLMHLEGERSPLSQLSLALIYRFALTRKDICSSSLETDPYYADVPNMDKFSKEEIENMRSFGPRPLGDLMNELAELKESNKE